jgi:hypothetical protein
MVLCSQESSGRGGGNYRVSSDVLYWGVGQGVLQSVGAWGMWVVV